MKRVHAFAVDVPLAPAQIAAELTDLRRQQRLHPLLRAVTLESEAEGVRWWRCEDRLLGLTLVYRAAQRVDADGRGFVTDTALAGLALRNVWRFEAAPRGARVRETLTFEGRAPTVWLAAALGARAHGKLFAAIAAAYDGRVAAP